MGLIPLFVGAIYYNERVVGGLWMRATGLDAERLRQGNMAVIYGMTYLFSILVAVMLSSMVIHQMAMGSLLMEVPGWGDEASEVMEQLTALDEKTGSSSTAPSATVLARSTDGYRLRRPHSRHQRAFRAAAVELRTHPRRLLDHHACPHGRCTLSISPS